MPADSIAILPWGGKAIATHPPSTSGLIFGAEHLLQEFALVLKVILEFVAILMIAIALIKSLQRFFRDQKQHRNPIPQQSIRLEFGLFLALSLEFLLAADIVGTAVSPSWDAIAKLAAITGIRTFLNFFLQREVRELQATTCSAQYLGE
ncbi:MAG: DUF1622 domain-containing protein [Acaryochloris sp. RU_4_1]|nr:DUF1622 domain-containing protein [Acaryochloris sp. RU_4_1]